jgi:hypothetical protein
MLTKHAGPTTQSTIYQNAIGGLIWLAFAAVGIGALAPDRRP